MTIEFLMRVLTNRLTRLRDAKIQAEANGDLERIVELDTEITETEATLAALRSL
jgi:hypothetical protein